MEASQENVPWVVECDPLDLNLLENAVKIEPFEEGDENSTEEKSTTKKMEVKLEETRVRQDRVKTKVRKSYKCLICQKQYAKSSNLTHHIETVHKKDLNLEKETEENLLHFDHSYPMKTYSKIISCEHCDKTFSKYSNLFAHLGNVHNIVKDAKDIMKELNDATKDPDCIICPKVSELNELVQAVFTKDELIEMEPYHCIGCGKSSTWDGTDLDTYDDYDEDPSKVLKIDPDADMEMTEGVAETETHAYPDSIANGNSGETSLAPAVPKKKKKKKKKNRMKKFRCQFCPKMFYGTQDLENHINNFHDKVVEATPFQCETCQKYLSDQSALNKHIRTQHEIPEGGLDCKYCDEKFPNANQVRFHVKMVHKKRTHFSCETCKLTFLENSKLMRHNRLIHNEIQIVKCKLCKEEFHSHRDLKLHMRQKHEKFLRNECEFCENKYSCATTLWTHIFKVHQKLEPFQCEQCGKNFTRMSILKHHLKTKHLDHKPFQCHICGSSFQNSSNLKVHIDKHAAKNDGNDLQVEKPGPVECELCQRVFLRHKNYARHKEIFHNPDPVRRNSLKKQKRDELRCRLCNLTFTSQRYLEKHNATQKHAMALAKSSANS